MERICCFSNIPMKSGEADRVEEAKKRVYGKIDRGRLMVIFSDLLKGKTIKSGG